MVKSRTVRMPCLYVCPLSGLSSVAASLGRFDLLTLLSPDHKGEDHRALACERHRELSFHDITEARPGLVAPDSAVVQVIAFARDWDRKRPMLIHCWAGISRSTATAFTIACMLNPHGREARIAEALRAASPFAYPNARIVALADHLLSRDGRMVDALDRMGPAIATYESQLFSLGLEH